jgi:hypothetical protein
MTAAAAEVMVAQEKTTRLELPLLGGKKAYKGASCGGMATGGTVRPMLIGAAGAGATDLFVGIFAETIDNSSVTAGGATQLVTVDFLKEKTILYRANDGSITAANIFQACYAADDQTASLTSTNSAKLGTILKVDSVLGVGFEVEGL